MPLKIIVTGAYSTGKTTLVGALDARLRQSSFKGIVLKDVARECPFPLNEAQGEDGTLWLLSTQLAREISATQQAEDYILCDRGIPDVMAHHLDAGGGRIEGRIGLAWSFLVDWLQTYDVILASTTDPSIPVLPDGLRVEDPAYRARLAARAHEVTSGLAHVTNLPTEAGAAIDAAFIAVERSFVKVRTE